MISGSNEANFGQTEIIFRKFYFPQQPNTRVLQKMISGNDLLPIQTQPKGAFGCCKMFSRKYIFSGNANFRKRKMFSAVWLSRKLFSGKSIPVFGSSKHFTENQFQCLIRPNILRKIPYGNRFTENNFQCFVCGSFLQKI